ncbi:hypothetical protein [Streptomyces sp. NPDC001714]
MADGAADEPDSGWSRASGVALLIGAVVAAYACFYLFTVRAVLSWAGPWP